MIVYLCFLQSIDGGPDDSTVEGIRSTLEKRAEVTDSDAAKSAEEDRRDLAQLLKTMEDQQQQRLERASSSVGGITLVGSSSLALPSRLPYWQRPARVVKKVIRSVAEDGTETITVQYIFGDEHVNRVMSETQKMRTQQQRLKEAMQRNREAGNIMWAEDDREEDVEKVMKGELGLKLDKGMRSKAIAERDDAHYGLGPEVGISGQTNRKKHVSRDIRLPQCVLATKLEDALMSQWVNKIAAPFKYPVDVDRLPGYRQRVARPICLNDIRDKIGQCFFIW